jgi:hypothetical protein
VADLIGGSAIRRNVSPADPVGKLPPSSRCAFTLSPKLRRLLLRAKDHKLAELDPGIAQLASQLVERGLDGRRLGNGVAAVFPSARNSVSHPADGDAIPVDYAEYLGILRTISERRRRACGSRAPGVASSTSAAKGEGAMIRRGPHRCRSMSTAA